MATYRMNRVYWPHAMLHYDFRPNAVWYPVSQSMMQRNVNERLTEPGCLPPLFFPRQLPPR